MIMPNEMRPEAMPMMVYAVCKAVKRKEYTRNELIKAISVTDSVKDDVSADQASKVVNFSIESELVNENKDTKVLSTELNDYELSSPKEFSYAINKLLIIKDSKRFSDILNYYLWNGNVLENAASHKEFTLRLSADDSLKFSKLTEEYIHGFLFWIDFMGIATHCLQTGNSMGGYNYSIEDILLTFIEKNRENLVRRGFMSISEFFGVLSAEISWTKLCYKEDTIAYSLSFALNVLEKMEYISLLNKSDGSQSWKLVKSNASLDGISYTNIKVN